MNIYSVQAAQIGAISRATRSSGEACLCPVLLNVSEMPCEHGCDNGSSVWTTPTRRRGGCILRPIRDSRERSARETATAWRCKIDIQL